jgi:hypothetical protein
MATGTYDTARRRVRRVDPRKDSTTAWVGAKGASGGASTGFPAGQDREGQGGPRQSGGEGRKLAAVRADGLIYAMLHTPLP